MTRLQCEKCPWRKGVDPYDIPNGYDVDKHRALKNTVAVPGSLYGIGGSLRVMACHDSAVGKELPCVGWLVNQLGVGQNIGLRYAVATGKVSGDVACVGEQHDRFEDTLPKQKRRRIKQAMR